LQGAYSERKTKKKERRKVKNEIDNKKNGIRKTEDDEIRKYK